MSKPLIVSIPHQHGKAEATRRLRDGMGQLKSQFGDKLASIEQRWEGDRMNFNVGAMGQTVTGHVDVMDDSVRVEVNLPRLLQMVANKAKTLIQKQGTLMLEKK
jgi:putative polyhydroxyalkanoate system protein